jgi:hypothetical protein
VRPQEEEEESSEGEEGGDEEDGDGDDEGMVEEQLGLRDANGNGQRKDSAVNGKNADGDVRMITAGERHGEASTSSNKLFVLL